MKDTRIALVLQNSIPGAFDTNLAGCRHFISKAAKKKSDIIVFPEMNLTGYVSGRELQQIARPLTDALKNTLLAMSKEFNIIVLAGLARTEEHSGHIFACHTVSFPDGSFFLYDKIHIAPFEKICCSHGNKVPLFSSPTITFGIQLCYDAHFPCLSTAMALKGADIIFMPHASPRGSSMEKKKSWLRHLTARAFDNGIFIAACNQAGSNKKGLEFPGVALVIGPDGNIISQRLSNNREAMLVTDLRQTSLEDVRTHKMKYFLPNRRDDLYACGP